MAAVEIPTTIIPRALPKVANLAPLGLAAFGITTVALSCINAGLLPPEAGAAVVPWLSRLEGWRS